MVKRSTTLIEWYGPLGGVVSACNVSCRRNKSGPVDICPCTGLCKGMTAKQATEELKSKGHSIFIEYARTKPFVSRVKIAPEIVQLDIEFDRED